MERPQFRSDLRAELIANQGVILFSERQHYVLWGRVYELLAPLLDGHFSEDQIIARLRKKAPLADLYYALARLEQKGFLVEAPSKRPNLTPTFWNSLGISDELAETKLRRARVSLILLDPLQKHAICDALRSLKIATASSSGFTLLITDDYLRPEITKWNKQLFTEKRTWMLMKLTGNEIWLGPIIRPGTTGCWECLAHRLELNRVLENLIQPERRILLTPKPYLSSITSMAANLAATEIARWLIEDKNEKLEGKIITFHVRDFKIQSHTLLKREHCKTCGSSKKSKTVAPLSIESSPKNHLESGYRLISAEETIRKYQHHISPITGVISHLFPASPPGSPLKVYTAGYNKATKGRAFQVLRHCVRTNSGGKGTTDANAKAGAMCEAMERYSGQFMGGEIRIRSSYNGISDQAIYPNDLMLFSYNQYLNRDKQNKDSRMNFVTVLFDPDRKIDWTPAWSLTNSRFKYVPTSYCYYGYSNQSHPIYCVADSNGNAAGNTKEEAIVQGFCELVERDSVAIWWYNLLRRPGVDLDTFDDPYLHQLKEFYDGLDRDFWVLDVTTDLKIPTFAALTRKRSSPEGITMGFGAHLDFRYAILRAVTEAGQLFPPEGDTSPWDDPDAIEWWNDATIEKHPYLLPDPKQSYRTRDDYEEWRTNDFRDDVMHCVERARAHGLETLVLDQSRTDIGMPVVKVMVPGLRHFWARFAPGRLYETPVRMGNLKKPKKESDLNPVHLFL